MNRNIINFKGVKEGVFLDIEGSNMDLIKQTLNKKINNTPGFYEEIKLLGIRADSLTDEEILDLGLILKYKYDFNISLDQLIENLIESYLRKEKSKSQNPLLNETHEGLTKFQYGTLRSGQLIEFEGNIVVIGDVNPGAMLKAEGNILVLGNLRGVAHAGLGGNSDALVAAYNLLPTQLRIGDIIVRAPDGDVSEFKLPEVARIHNGEVIIEPYLPNK